MTDNERYELVRLGENVHGIHSHAYGETCHPIIGPEREARHLYVEGLDLPARLAARAGKPLVIWDVGLGSAANPLTLLHALGPVPGTVCIHSFDRTSAPLIFALEQASKLPFLLGFEDPVRALITQGSVSFRHKQLQVQWRFVQADFPSVLRSPESAAWPKPHALLFDPHSPARNPEMWTLPLFASLLARLDPDRPCALSTYSRSTLVRTAMLMAGFYVGRGGGAGAKEETTLAANCLGLLRHPLEASWLERIRHSSSAEPLREGIYAQTPLLPSTLARLKAHPQFRSP